jgi:ATP-dependent Zn protease
LHQVGAVTFAADGIHWRTRSELLGELLICLAGMAAEIEVFERHGTGSSGAEVSDLSMATNWATRIEAVHGMGQALVSETCDELELRRLRLTNPLLWQRVDAILKESLEVARAVVRDNRPVLEALAKELIRSKLLSGEDINTFFEMNSIRISMNSLRFPRQ